MRLFKDNDLIQEGFVKSGIIAIIVCLQNQNHTSKINFYFK